MASWFRGQHKDEHGADEPTEVVEPVTPPRVAEEVGLVDEFPEEAVAVGVAPEVHDQAVQERRSMVALCLYAHDRARSSGVAERIEEGLAAVGVVALRPDGERFDPAFHEAGGTVGTDDAALDGTVAETEVVGFSDRGVLLRPPIVTVYTSKAVTP
ncbi:nucleotide exchange factor GrpE [Actinokineospora auranticolor]|uniref:GrpE protein n=1 Tax=Actinokineospora auranticolor TaxID=155976 RepID=A0A2S6GRX9_9PSEU|nr:nucleotide exchange factor GrpE [Actinokineospora auranticolor]PPK68002.1 GrpE protein [Actinokineospora auranticolor]